jgi:hypothetical protein
MITSTAYPIHWPIFVALQKAGVLAEMHLHAQGGHAFGLRHTALAITEWPQLVETWLNATEMIRK